MTTTSPVSPPKQPHLTNFNALLIRSYTVWLMYGQACPDAPSPDACAAAGPARMWRVWQQRRFHPQLSYGGFPLLTYWPSYVTQLPFYLSAAFSADAAWAALFRASWQADRAYFASDAYYAPSRYGLAAGATDANCSVSGSGYEADQIDPDPASAQTKHTARQTSPPLTFVEPLGTFPTGERG